jgi:polyisoprenoid-binding protein YceI
MQSSNLCKRYTIDASASSLTYEAGSSLHVVSGIAQAFSGYIDVAWDDRGRIASEPAAAMRMEVPVTKLRSGSPTKDQEIWRLIDVGRFPLIVAELRSIEPLYGTSIYQATGNVTVAGRTRSYTSQMLVVTEDFSDVSVRGDLEIDIRDYGLEPPRMVFVRIEPIIAVHLSLVAYTASMQRS